MIGFPEPVPIYLFTEPVDFRNGFDGLTGIVTTRLKQPVTTGSLFLFVNRRHTRLVECEERSLWPYDVAFEERIDPF